MEKDVSERIDGPVLNLLELVLVFFVFCFLNHIANQIALPVSQVSHVIFFQITAPY